MEGITEPIDLSSLKKLVNLKSLTLSYTNAENLDFLGELPHLEYLQLEGVGLEQLPDFGKLRLKSVNINDSDIESLDFIKNWDALEYLSLSSARLSSLEGIQQAKNLEGLLISNNPVNDISLLKELDVLERLELRSTRVTDLSPLAALEDLKLLDIRDADVRSSPCCQSAEAQNIAGYEEKHRRFAKSSGHRRGIGNQCPRLLAVAITLCNR
ncbi:leucine-rich repeat domain-containing protein [Paenibacillus sp. TH7-28]